MYTYLVDILILTCSCGSVLELLYPYPNLSIFALSVPLLSCHTHLTLLCFYPYHAVSQQLVDGHAKELGKTLLESVWPQLPEIYVVAAGRTV